MKIGIFLSLVLLAMAFLPGCYYDVEEDLYPAAGSSCDTTNVTYTLTVKPIMDQSCNSCHSQSAQQGGVILDNYNDVLAYANSGQLLGAIRHDSGYEPMPLGGGKLSACNIIKIEAWVQSGSPNN